MSRGYILLLRSGRVRRVSPLWHWPKGSGALDRLHRWGGLDSRTLRGHCLCRGRDNGLLGAILAGRRWYVGRSLRTLLLVTDQDSAQVVCRPVPVCSLFAHDLIDEAIQVYRSVRGKFHHVRYLLPEVCLRQCPAII